MRYLFLLGTIEPHDMENQELSAANVREAYERAKAWKRPILCATDERGRRYDSEGNQVRDSSYDN